MLKNSLIKLVTCSSDGLRDNNTAHGDNGNLGSAATDVYNHRTCRILNWKVCTNCCSHRLFNQECLASACLNSCFKNSAFLDRCNARRNANNYAWTWRPRIFALSCLLDEVTKHNLSNIKVCNDAVFKRALSDDGARSTANHALCIGANSQNAALAFIDCNNRWLIDDNTLTTNCNKGVCSSQIDG